MRWADVAPHWRRCFELAWAGHLEGSNPIAALIVDAKGREVSSGTSAVRVAVEGVVIAHNEIAHAEVNALLGLDNRLHPRDRARDYRIYATLEPCPVCFGAFYMSDVGSLHFAASDRFGGSTNLLGATPYLSRKARTVVGPEPVLDEFSIFLNVYHDLRAGAPQDDPVHAALALDYPEAVRIGRLEAAGSELADTTEVSRVFERYRVMRDG